VPLNRLLTSPGLLGSEPNHGVRARGLARSFRGDFVPSPAH